MATLAPGGARAASAAVAPGSSAPIGPTVTADGVNFSVFSQRATGMDLLLFDAPADDAPSTVLPLDRATNRTGGYWHGFVPGIGAGQVYAFRARGPWAPAAGVRFDERLVLLDPYGRGVAVPPGYARDLSPAAPDAIGRSMKSVVVDLSAYDWEGDRPLNRPLHDTVVYEAHVRGFTAHPNSGVTDARRGTYAGFIERIPYLVDLGVSAIELLPVFQFDRLAAPAGRPNYWGYQPVSYFAPHAPYSSRPDALGAADEFRDLVKALHRAGLEVILDVVYNHTAESGLDGPTFCFRGLANEEYYLLDGRGGYADYSGTGNSLDANAAVVRRLIVDSLRFWVSEMHVDGFRFDLASVLSRDEDGRPLARPPILWDIDSDPVLSGTKLIAEAWDAAGLYQVGSFVGDRWVEWNGRFRDDVRGVRARRSRPRLGREPAADRQPGPVRARQSRGAEDGQLRHLPRRVHPRRPGQLRPQAQRGERRGQPRRDQRQPQLEWRRRGRDRRSRHHRAAPPPGEEPPDADPARRRRADADHGRRGAAQPGREQQRLLPGQRAQLVRLVGRRARGRHAALHRVPDRGAPARPGAARSADRRDAGGAAGNGAHRLARRGAGPAGSLVRLAKPRSHDQRPIGGAPHHRQRLLGAARLRTPASRGRARPGSASSTRPSHPRTTSASARRPRPSRQPPIGWVRAPSWSSPPRLPSPRRPTRDHPDARRSIRSASGWPTPATSRRVSTAPARGTCGVRTWPNGRGARCARTTAPTATRGPTSRTITPVPGPTAGTRTGWPGCPTCSGGCASGWRCGTAATRSSRSGCSASRTARATTARTPRTTGGTSMRCRRAPGCAGVATTIRRPSSRTRTCCASTANARSSRASTSCSTRACSTPATGWSRSTTRRPTRPTS